jgi:hypothetical protein
MTTTSWLADLGIPFERLRRVPVELFRDTATRNLYINDDRQRSDANRHCTEEIGKMRLYGYSCTNRYIFIPVRRPTPKLIGCSDTIRACRRMLYSRQI